MNPDVLEVLGYQRTLRLIQGFAQSEAGSRRLAAQSPSTDEGIVQQQLDLLSEGCRFLAENGRKGIAALGDPEPLLQELALPSSVFQPPEILLIRDLLQLARELRQLLAPGPWRLLSVRWSALDDPAPLLSQIDSTLEPTGEVRESADPELAQVRQRGARARRKLEEKLSALLSGRMARFLIPEPFVTQRNDRFVLPVRVEHQKDVGGLVHGASASGATVFLEPMEAVDLNNEWIFCREREKEIIHRLLVRLTSQLREQLPRVMPLFQAVADFDALQSKAAFAESFSCVVPRVMPEGEVRLIEARHPLLLERLGSEEVVPLTLRLGEPQRALVISGPNAGGKTVTLKTVGLLALMAQSGLPVPAREAELPLFQQILADIGDRQSIAEDLSTFSAHIIQIREMASGLQPPSLVLLDELGTGTDPAYGAALGIAILEHFQQKGVTLIATTHHLAVKQYAETAAGVVNASVGLDPETLRPTYRLNFGVFGESSALEIAGQLGLPSQIVQAARARLDSRAIEVETFLARLREEQRRLQSAQVEADRERRELEATRVQLETVFQKREESRRQQLETALERWQREFKESAERYLKRTHDRFEAARLRTQTKARSEALREAFRRKMAQETQPRDQDVVATEAAGAGLAPGDEVYDDFFKKRGKLVEIDGDSAILEVSGKRISTSLKRLAKLEEKSVEKQSSPHVRWSVVENTDPELNLIGLRVEEALDKTDKYLDRAFLSQLRQVRLIHGFGTGRLKEALQEFLAGHPHVSRSQVEGGATVVDLRE